MQKKGLTQIISEKFDIPLESLSSVPNAQIIGNNILSLNGCIGIKKYETDQVIIRTKDFLLTITGTDLTMLAFSQGRVSIKGEIKMYGIEAIWEKDYLRNMKF